MHLVCLGVTKRMLTYLKQGPRVCKLSNPQVNEISDNLQSLNGKLPSEFARQPRRLCDLDRRKATEFRQFLLYTGPLVLKGIVSSKVYKHFLTYHVALSILLTSNNETRNFYLGYAQELLAYFVSNAKKQYGDTFTVYNVHNLLHLHEDVAHFDCSLNDISAFPFENHMQTLKRFVRNSINPISQVIKRQTELECTTFSRSDNSCSIAVRQRDSCFLTCNGKLCLVKENLPGKRYKCDVFKIDCMENLYCQPLKSKDLAIGFIRNLTRISTTSKVYEKSAFVKEIVLLPWHSGYAMFPMLHDVEGKS